jgi:response regulator RpfG family c-di-GMP phosphodiesterase
VFPAISVIASIAAVTIGSLVRERGRATRAAQDQELARRLMVQSLLSLTEIRDADTGSHSRRTQEYCRRLAEQLRDDETYRDYLTPDRVELLASLAPLHDIGKVGVPDQLLNKPAALTPDEYREMQKHPGYGLNVITNAQRNAGATDDDVALAMAREIVYTHHERWDGKGYPRGLRGTQIPIPGRLMAVVDVYDALTSSRCYRPPLPRSEALNVLVLGRGTHFDPAVVDAFMRIAPTFQDAALQALAYADPGVGRVAPS